MKNITRIIFVLIAIFFVVGIATTVNAETKTTDRLSVCSRDMQPFNNCVIEDTALINLSEGGVYSVSGLVGRGTIDDSCQANESFDLYIDGNFYAHSEDPDPCEPGTNDVHYTEQFPTINLSAGLHTILMRHSLWNQPATSAESVDVYLTFTSGIPLMPSCDMNSNVSLINPGQSATLSWTSQRVSTASINQGIGTVPVEGSRSVSPSQTTTYTGTFTGPGGTTSCQTTITVREEPPSYPMPSCDMSVSPSTIDEGDSAVLNWSSSDVHTVIINNGVGSVSPNGSVSVSPSQTTTYTGTFTGPGGVTTCRATLNIEPTVPEIPTCTSDINPSSIEVGESATLSWTSTNATSIEISGVDLGNIGFYPNIVPSGSVDVSPEESTIYTLTFTGPGGATSCQETLVVEGTPPPSDDEPVCSMSASPANITAGSSSTLSWQSDYVTSAVINNGVGSVPVDGSASVSPNQTTTYTGTFTGPGGVATCSATVTVSATPHPDTPNISIVIDDNDNNDDTQTVSSGGTAVFSIVVTNTGSSNLIDVAVTDALAPDCDRSFSETASLYPGLVFNPGESFSYVCNDSNVTASYVNSARVDANEIGTSASVNDIDITNVVVEGTPPAGNDPTCSMSFNPNSINVGEATTLSWNSTRVTTVSIDNNVGNVNPDGSMQIFRTSTATYTGTFTGPGGTVTCQATINVGGGGGGGGSTGPRITLSSNVVTEEPGFIYLSQIPYTGIPQFLIAMMGYLFRIFAFGGLLYGLYRLR